MIEEKTYIYYLKCANCERENPLKIPLGISGTEFLNKCKAIYCSYCGCNVLTGDSAKKVKKKLRQAS